MIKDERGVTLVELLAVFVIGAIISVLATATLLGGFKTNERVITEAQLRDEADLIMASLLQDLYILKENEVTTEFDPSANRFLIHTDGQQIGFNNGHVQRANGETLTLQGNVKISDETKISKESNGEYVILLVLKDNVSQKKLEVESVISLIKDSGG